MAVLSLCTVLAALVSRSMLAVLVVLAVLSVDSMLAVLFVCPVLAVLFVWLMLAITETVTGRSVGCVSLVVFVAHSVDSVVVTVVVSVVVTVGVWFVDARCHLRGGDADRASDCKQYDQCEPDSDECLCHFDLLSCPYSRLVDMGMGVNTASKTP